MRLARCVRKSHRVEPRDQVAGGQDRIDGFLALGQMPGLADQLDQEREGRGVHRHRLQIGRFRIDEIIRPQPGIHQRLGAHSALKFADHEGEDDVATQPNPGIQQRLHGAEISAIASLHVGHADAVDEVGVDLAGPRIDRPTLGHRVGVEMAIEQQAPSPARAAPTADRVDPIARHRRQLRLESQAAKLLAHELDQDALAVRLAVALVLHHLRQQREAGGLVDVGEDLVVGQGDSPRSRATFDRTKSVRSD